MKRAALVVAAFGILGTVIAFAATAGATQSDQNAAALEKKVAALEQRITALEEQVKQLSTAKVVLPTVWPQTEKLPEGWQQREFNGMRYFVVPLKPGADKGMKVTR